MVWVVKKEGKRSYVVKNRYTNESRRPRATHAEAQRLADKLNRMGARARAQHVFSDEAAGSAG